MLALRGEGELTWTVRNPTDRTLRLALADDLAPSLRATTRRVRGTVPGGATLRSSTALRPSRRGRFEIRHLVVRVEGPLGLGARQRRIDQPDLLRVHPAFPSREEAELRINKARILEVGLRSAKGRGGGTEFDQLREYGVDDEVRRIDWAATARAGKAMVRTYRAERNQNVLLLLDNGRVMAGQVADVPRVEHAMDALMCLTTVATRLGDRCGLVAFDRTVRSVLPARSGRDQLGRVAEAMFDLEPALAESDYRGAFTQALARFKRRSLIVLFTDLVEQAVGESLLPALPLLVRHHVVIVAAVRDPTSCGGPPSRPTTRRTPTEPPPPPWPSPSATAPPPASTAWAPSSSTPPPASSPPSSPTPISTSRPEVACSRRQRLSVSGRRRSEVGGLDGFAARLDDDVDGADLSEAVGDGIGMPAALHEPMHAFGWRPRRQVRRDAEALLFGVDAGQTAAGGVSRIGAVHVRDHGPFGVVVVTNEGPPAGTDEHGDDHQHRGEVPMPHVVTRACRAAARSLARCFSSCSCSPKAPV